MTFSAAGLYDLLPTMLRTADAASGAALQALIGVIAEQVTVLDNNDMRRFYADQFIETCETVGNSLHRRSDSAGPAWPRARRGALTSRAEVANTLGYRRRKRNGESPLSKSPGTSPAGQRWRWSSSAASR